MKDVQSLVVLGAGGLARETVAIVQAINAVRRTWEILGFVSPDKQSDELLIGMGYRNLGSDKDFFLDPIATNVICAIADPKTRSRIFRLYSSKGFNFISLVHPNASLEGDTHLGAGCIVGNQVIVTSNVRIGVCGIVDRGSMVGHDSILGDFVTLHPRSTTAGNVSIGAFALIGACACLLPGVIIGNSAVIGAGAVVTKDVPEEATTVGNPARPL